MQKAMHSPLAARIDQASTLANELGLVLIEGNDARNGRFRIQQGRDFVHLADDIEDVASFLNAWAAYVH
jgi:hypothetical protein